MSLPAFFQMVARNFWTPVLREETTGAVAVLLVVFLTACALAYWPRTVGGGLTPGERRLQTAGRLGRWGRWLLALAPVPLGAAGIYLVFAPWSTPVTLVLSSRVRSAGTLTGEAADAWQMQWRDKVVSVCGQKECLDAGEFVDEVLARLAQVHPANWDATDPAVRLKIQEALHATLLDQQARWRSLRRAETVVHKGPPERPNLPPPLLAAIELSAMQLLVASDNVRVTHVLYDARSQPTWEMAPQVLATPWLAGDHVLLHPAGKAETVELADVTLRYFDAAKKEVCALVHLRVTPPPSVPAGGEQTPFAINLVSNPDSSTDEDRQTVEVDLKKARRYRPGW